MTYGMKKNKILLLLGAPSANRWQHWSCENELEAAETAPKTLVTFVAQTVAPELQ